MSLTLETLFRLGTHLTLNNTSPYIIGSRKIGNTTFYIIDINQTLYRLRDALQLIEDTILAGGSLFLTGLPYVCRKECEYIHSLEHSWSYALGYEHGTLTNLSRTTTQRSELALYQRTYVSQLPALTIDFTKNAQSEAIRKECKILDIPLISFSDTYSKAPYIVPTGQNLESIVFYVRLVVNKLSMLYDIEKIDLVEDNL